MTDEQEITCVDCGNYHPGTQFAEKCHGCGDANRRHHCPAFLPGPKRATCGITITRDR